MSSTLSHTIVEECKNMVLKHVLDDINRENLVSLILFGSIARDEPRFRYHDEKLFLDSDIDLLVVVKSSAIRRSMILLRGLSEKITSELRENKLMLSEIELAITTEEKLLNAPPSTYYMHLKRCGKVIFGKDLVSSMPNYRNSQIPYNQLLRYLFENMTKTLKTFLNSDFSKQKTHSESDSYRSLLNSVEKLTAIMIRVVLMKEDVYPNPWIGPSDFINLKTKEKVHRSEYSRILDNLLNSYGELLAARDQYEEENLSLDDVKKYWARVVDQFNLTLGVLLPSSLNDILLTSSTANIMLTKSSLSGDKSEASAIRRIVGNNYIYLSLYRLFISSPSILESVSNRENEQERYRRQFNSKKSRLQVIKRLLNFWRLSYCIFIGLDRSKLLFLEI
jgi:predicted nucleotidyltransferase